MSLLFSTETLFTNKSIELLTEQNDRNKKVIYELKIENTKLTKRIEELEKSMDKLVDVLHRTDPTLTKQAKRAKRRAEFRAIMKKKRLEEPERMNSDALAKVRAEWMTKNSK
tara:strand:+ start:198 stop:533 length:336 start_codon:yes stop_codon:yes gene_type:complete